MGWTDRAGAEELPGVCAWCLGMGLDYYLLAAQSRRCTLQGHSGGISGHRERAPVCSRAFGASMRSVPTLVSNII